MTVYAIHETTSGKLVSVGTIVADPLPVGLTVVELSNPDAIRLRDGTGRWDPVTRAVVDRPASELTAEQNRQTISDRAVTALTANTTYLAIASPSNAQNLAQIRLLTRETTGLIRLLLDQLDTLDGT